MESTSNANIVPTKSFLLHGTRPSSLPFATQAFLDNHSNFDKSGLPSKVFSFAPAEGPATSTKWEVFPPEVLEIFKKGFASKIAEVPVVINGRSCIVDFARMILIDPNACCLRSIAWVDDKNICFFPKRAVNCACWRKQPNQARQQPEEPKRFVPGIPDLNL